MMTGEQCDIDLRVFLHLRNALTADELAAPRAAAERHVDRQGVDSRALAAGHWNALGHPHPAAREAA